MDVHAIGSDGVVVARGWVVESHEGLRLAPLGDGPSVLLAGLPLSQVGSHVEVLGLWSTNLDGIAVTVALPVSPGGAR